MTSSIPSKPARKHTAMFKIGDVIDSFSCLYKIGHLRSFSTALRKFLANGEQQCCRSGPNSGAQDLIA